MRAAIERAMVATVSEHRRGTRDGDKPPRSRGLNPLELRVLLALIYLVPLFDVVSDRVSYQQIADVVFGKDAATPHQLREVRRAVATLAAVGVFEREPGKGNKASRITFPAEGGSEPHSEQQTEGGSEPQGQHEGEGFRTHTERGSEHQGEGFPDPTSEVLPETSSEAYMRGEFEPEFEREFEPPSTTCPTCGALLDEGYCEACNAVPARCA
jgi:hypothetical protein